MMPARIQLDFMGNGKRQRGIGLSILALGMAASALTVYEYQTLSTEAAIVELELPNEPSRKPRLAVAGSDSKDLREARRAMAALAVPWDALFAKLEATVVEHDDAVALLEIEPDVERQRLHVAAEAASLPAALEYVRSLQQDSPLRFPTLERHEIRTDQRERPIYFELTAGWSVTQ